MTFKDEIETFAMEFLRQEMRGSRRNAKRRLVTMLCSKYNISSLAAGVYACQAELKIKKK
jgi:hypothetical protein